ncbi:MAG: OstA-like protein [Alistipes sp.]|nr:OstA-like protein [Alistipes sp.]
MRRTLSALIVLLTFVGILYAQGITTRHVTDLVSEPTLDLPQKQEKPLSEDKKPKRKVDFMADLVRPYHREGDSIVCLVGNFAAHHNGAVIWCDSAVRYDDTHWGFFGRVVVNQDSIYMYGDSAIYDGGAAYAEIYAPIVKVVDGDALLYTYNFSFNTEDKVGSYRDGGVLVHDNNIIESQRGYYDAQNHDIICVEDVELHGDEYDMKSDSIIYNTDTEFARFFTNTEIWNNDGDYLSADEGHYDKQKDLYMVTRNGYILSKEQQIWGDTLSYYRTDGHVVALNNIQMDDFKNKMLAFGDYAEYWQEQGEAILTKNPSIVSYETSESDTVFISADTLHIVTIDPKKESADEASKTPQVEPKSDDKAELAVATPKVSDFAPKATLDKAVESKPTPSERKPISRGNKSALQKADSAAIPTQIAAPSNENNTIEPQNVAEQNKPSKSNLNPIKKDSLAHSIDSLKADSLAMDSMLADTLSKMTPKQRKAFEAKLRKDQERKLKEAEKRAEAKERKIKLDSIAKIRQAKITAQLEKEKARQLELHAKDSLRRAAQRAKAEAKGKDLSEFDRLDSIAALRGYILRHGAPPEQPVEQAQYAGRTEEPVEESQAQAQDSLRADSAYRVVKAFRGVRIYRSDAQAVCDSLVTNSVDSIVHLYISPVMWNNQNQIAATTVDLYSKNQQLTRAEFLGDPIMVAEIDTTYYNQVAGKKMIAMFKDNEIYRNDVDGNVQTIYFQQQEGGSLKITEMIYLESASASFYIENRELVGMTYRNDTPFKLYPLDLIPADQPLKLKNFKWVPSLRPSRESVFTRSIRESEREVRGARKRPTFNIVEKMDRRKEVLVMSGEWIDREDQLTPELVEWRDRCMQEERTN